MPQDKRYRVEGYWDCQYCGRTAIKGRFKSCPGCGHGRDASVKFYTLDIDEDHAITQEEFIRETTEADKNSRSDSANYSEAQAVDAGTPSLFDRSAGEGTGAEGEHDASDWYCDYCDSYNPATANFCRNCGAQREMSSGQTYEQTMGKTARTYDAQGNLIRERDLSTRKKPEVAASAARPAARTNSKGCLTKVLIGVGLVALLAIVFSVIFAPKPRDVTVKSFDWEQTIQIEELTTVEESDWSLPSGARLDHKSQEIRRYDHVLDHYETEEYEVPEQVLDHYETYTTTVDNGDGTFEVEEHQEPVYTTEYRIETRQVPVYIDVPIFDTKYYYKLERWKETRQVVTSGKDHKPTWGEVKLSEATGEYGTGEEREGSRWGTYGVTDSEGNHYTADKDLWDSLEKGQTISVMVDNDGHMTLPEK